MAGDPCEQCEREKVLRAAAGRRRTHMYVEFLGLLFPEISLFNILSKPYL